MGIHVLSWNIWWGGVYLDKVIKFLSSSHADIIALQEVTQTPSGENNTADLIADKLGMKYVYGTGVDVRPLKPFVMGNAILTKLPILTSKTQRLGLTNTRVAIQADIHIQNSIIHMITAHLVHTHQKPSVEQERQASDLVIFAPKDHTIIAGDFNATQNSQTVANITKQFMRVDSSNDPTWCVYEEKIDGCVKSLSVRLDYFFKTPDINTSDFRIEQSDGSDHLPISMDIDI